MPDDLLRLDDQFCFAVHSLARAIVHAYEPLLAELDLTYPQYLVLLVLWETNDVSLKALGCRLRLDSGTLTPLTKRLETKGLLSRTRSTADERELVVALTSAGRRLKQRAQRVPAGILTCLGLPAGRLLKTRDELKAVLAALELP